MIKINSIEEYLELAKDSSIDFYLKDSQSKHGKDFLYLSPAHFKRLKRNHKVNGDELANNISYGIYYLKN